MPQKTSKLLSRRQANCLLQPTPTLPTPTTSTSFALELPDLKTTDSHTLLSIHDFPPHSLSVKIPSRFSRINLFYSKLRSYFWGDILPKNTLYDSFFVQPIVLAYIRLLALFMFACGFGWTVAEKFLLDSERLQNESSLLTVWALGLGFVYFFMVFCTQDLDDDQASWKVAYIVGEQAVVFNLLNVVVFYGSLVADWMNGKDRDTGDLLYNLCVYGFCMVLIMLELVWNHLTFYEKHRVFLYCVLMVYLVGDVCVGMIQNGSWKINWEWLVKRKYGIKIAMIGGLMLEFFFCNKFYNWKASRKSSDKSGGK